MAWTETYLCDVCGVAKGEDQHDWWLVSPETISPTANDPEQQVMRVTAWNSFLAHSPEFRHLCGARCTHTELDRWMTPLRDNLHS